MYVPQPEAPFRGTDTTELDAMVAAATERRRKQVAAVRAKARTPSGIGRLILMVTMAHGAYLGAMTGIYGGAKIIDYLDLGIAIILWAAALLGTRALDRHGEPKPVDEPDEKHELVPEIIAHSNEPGLPARTLPFCPWWGLLALFIPLSYCLGACGGLAYRLLQ